MAAIPTFGPRGIKYRSRIEARWAYVFDKLDWKWEYEPIDLKNYIPDFIISFPKGKLLVEIKGDLDIWSTYKPYSEKIIKSGWNGYYAILRSTIKKHISYDEDWVSVGVCNNIKIKEYMADRWR